MQELLSTTVHKLDARPSPKIKILLVELVARAKSAFAACDEGLLLVNCHVVETNSPFHVGVHDLPQVIARACESLIKLLFNTELRLRNPNGLLHRTINRQICHELGVRARWGRTGVFAISAHPSSHLAHLCNGLEGEQDPAVEASGESLRVDRLTLRTFPPPAIHMALILGNVLFGKRSIGIFAIIGGGVSQDLSVNQIRVIQHPRLT